MPLYEYKNTLTGERFERILPVPRRDDPCSGHITRVNVPARVRLVGLGAPVTLESKTIKAFHRLEDDADATRKFEAESGFSMKEAARIWKAQEATNQPIEV